MSSHEAVQFARVMTDHIGRQVPRLTAGEGADFGMVTSIHPVKVKILGLGLELDHGALWWSDQIALSELARGDKLALVCSSGQYVVLARILLGGH